jgi:hypothetical protein
LYHLGAVIHGAVTCKLGAAVHGAEVRVHFLKSFQKGHICENLFKKGPKNKKVGSSGSGVGRRGHGAEEETVGGLLLEVSKSYLP